ncbi:hypothetical protein BJP36_37125 [Moorena producens JHB]|uniref:Uncharacterized protein n=1 Tax=Moorena producens (strain JHB) TaxID=1454205 RepID=A0A9Q9SSJ4_MOOP1|nr:hypothetical protein [Moorena producens]WAN68858.1 hypothetical protein BJP36_41585 [Moorena producens JHB]WAN69018.1 hypothetical protein BJP36_42420 [Moorena producens JHB]WAN69716.1 hypothetical protein BJP36_37125 [Moorena producens JHB]
MAKCYGGQMKPSAMTHRWILPYAIMLVTAYIVELRLILCPYEVDSKTNEITALPAFIQQMALLGVVFAFDAISTQKNG